MITDIIWSFGELALFQRIRNKAAREIFQNNSVRTPNS